MPALRRLPAIRPRLARGLIAASFALSAAASCDSGGVMALGDVTSIIVAADVALWSEAGDSIQRTLERTVFTVRDEKTFQVTHEDPFHRNWGRLRLLRQQLLIGERADHWVAPALEKYELEKGAVSKDALPLVLQVGDVWARGQQATIILLPGAGQREAALAAAEEVSALLDEQYRVWVRNRMFSSGADEALGDSLSRIAGFSLLVPEVYQHAARDSVHIFRNDNPDPSELIRQIAVTWRTAFPEELPDSEEILAWRLEVAQGYYSYPQIHNLERIQTFPFDYRGLEARRVQAVWENPPEDFPAAGPFLTHAVACPAQGRIYLLDAWLYAPGKEKYQYMLQLENILGSFSCGAPEP